MPLIDNINQRLGDDLQQTLKKGASLSIAASSFSIYAFEALRKELSKIEDLRFIFTAPTLIEEKFEKTIRQFYIPHIYHEADLCGGDFELRLMNQLNQRAIAKECALWVADRVTFKTNKLSSQPLNGLVHVKNTENDQYSYNGINGFTTADLGLTPRQGFPTLIQKAAYPNSIDFLDWFDKVWRNEEDLEDITEKVKSYFENAYKENSCLLYTSPSPRDRTRSRMPSSA